MTAERGEPTSVLLQKRSFEIFGFLRQGMIMSCDLEFWTRVAIHTGAHDCDEPLVRFRVHGWTGVDWHRSSRRRTQMVERLR